MIIERRGLNDREESEQAREERLIRARGMQKSRSADGVQMLVRLIEPRELDRRESLGMIENVGFCWAAMVGFSVFCAHASQTTHRCHWQLYSPSFDHRTTKKSEKSGEAARLRVTRRARISPRT